jgi:hypothetical protein
MPTPEESFSTLDDFLLSLADGITQAQAELARSGALGPVGQKYVYHVPRVDFELRMNLRVVEDTALSQRYRQLRPARMNDKHLLFKPLAPEETSSTLEVAAVIRGAFVAVPANGGLPPLVIETRLDTSGPEKVLQIRLHNAAGEALPGVEVQVNLDREESASLTAAIGKTFTLAAGTGFSSGVVFTDAQGVATTTLTIGPGQSSCLLALVVDVADQTETLVYEVQP